MRGVWKMATILGVPVQIHWSFSLLFFWVYYEGLKNNLLWGEILSFTLLILALFACVVVHEFGHAIAARRYGVSTKDITLSPIGGAARLSKLPEKPIQEFVVALAGPLMNLLIAGAIAITFLTFSISFMPVLGSSPMRAFSNSSNFFQLLLLLNLFLALFNLIPAFPLDGGRMLRSVLAIKLGRLKATRIASLIGRLVAILLLLLAISQGDVLFGFVSVFVFFMAAHEYYMVRMDHVLTNQTIRDLEGGDFTKLQHSSSVREAINEFIKGKEKNFLVFNEEEKLCGILEEKTIRNIIKEKDTDSIIKKHLTQVYGAALLDDVLETVYYRMDNPVYSVLPVYEAGDLVGMVDVEKINKFIKKKVKNRFAI